MSDRKHPPPWLFGISGIPYGVVGQFAGIVMPFLTRAAGIKVDEIGWYGFLLLVPPMVQFLYAPIVDLKFKRKHWLIIVATLGAVGLVAATLTPIPQHVTAFLVFALLAQLVSGLVGSCNGGLLALHMPDAKRGAASAWLNIGNLSGGAISAAVAIWMVGKHYDPIAIALVLAAMMIFPALSILYVNEPEREHIQTAREVFGTTWHDVKSVLFSKSGITGIAMCISPVGTAALGNYFSAMATDYHATEDQVAFVSGAAASVLTAIGALVGGYLCDRVNRRAMYLLSGALTAACGIVMAQSPHVPNTYVYGVMVYSLITGFCYAAFTAVVLETIGEGGKAASAQYALFVAAGNCAIAYTGLIDTQFHERYGVNGVIWSDALLNLGGVLILGIVFWRLGSFGRNRPTATA